MLGGFAATPRSPRSHQWYRSVHFSLLGSNVFERSGSSARCSVMALDKRWFSASLGSDHKKRQHAQFPADGDEEEEYVDREKSKKARRNVGGLAAGATLLFGKAKYVLAALKVTKMAPLVSMVLTSATYSLFFGWPYSVGMVGLIFVHECGHAIAMRQYNVPFSPMVFVPFMGAVIAMKEAPKNVHQEAVIAIAGPALGSAGAAALAVGGALTQSQLLFALADFGFMINLFNLLPIGQLDGGRITSALSPWVNVAGLGLGGAMIASGAIHNPIFYLIMLSGTYTTASRLFGWEGAPHPSYYKMHSSQKLQIGSAYLGLIAALILAMRENNKRRLTPKQLKKREDQQQSGEGEFKDPFAYQDDTGTDELYDDFFFEFEDASRNDEHSSTYY